MHGYNNIIDFNSVCVPDIDFQVQHNYQPYGIIKYLKAIDYNYRLLYEYMDQYCKHNGIPLGAHFLYLNFDSILP